MKAYSQSIAFYGTIMTLSHLAVKSLLDHEIVYQRIHVILILPQGRRRISGILRRPSLWEGLPKGEGLNNLFCITAG
jgi:hypothetical protein